MTYAELIQYFYNIGEASRHIKSVIVADYDDILDLQSRELEYPALLIESPELQYQGTEDSIKEYWSTSIVILTNSDTNSKESILNAREQTYRIADKVMMRMHMDQDLVIMPIRNRRLLPIDPYTADTVQGWRIAVEYEVQYHNGDCDNPSDWDNTVPKVIQRFEWIDNSDTELNVTVNVTQLNMDSYSIYYSINNADLLPLTMTNHSGDITGAGDHLYIKMEAQYGTHTRVATAMIKRGDIASGVSVPYDYNSYED